MKLASIDIGTNSTLLLIAEYSSGQLRPIVNEVHITRLGQNVDKTGELQQQAMDRTFDVLQVYADLCYQYEVETVLVAGTSALRDAGNGKLFVQKVRKNLGFNIQIVTGDDEALLTYLATQQEFQETDGYYLILDVGGGSTEFIYGSQEQYLFAKSLNIGSVRLTENFISNDPPSFSELENISRHVHGEINNNLKNLEPDVDTTTLVGVAGTVTTLLAVDLEMTEYIPENIHRQSLTTSQVQNLLSRFTSLALNARKKLPGLHPERADVIIAGTLILLEVMNHYGFADLMVSDRGTRYGLIYKYLQSQNLIK